MKEFDVIIGAGTASLSARREVAKVTINYLVVEAGQLGTTCPRVGCMASKIIIQVANYFHWRKKRFKEMGIFEGEGLSLDSPLVIEHVRSLRDRFVGGVLNSRKGWEDKLMRKKASFRTLIPWT